MNRPDPLFTGKNRLHFSELESTNTYALTLLSKTKPPEGTCITADYQSGGIGQFGRSWLSKPGENLLVSFIFYPDFLDIRDQFLLNKVASLAVLKAIAGYSGTIAVKWPNDIYAGSRKVAGILIQNLLRGEMISATVIGIGLNINQTSFDSGLPNPTSLLLESGMPLDREELLHSLTLELEYRWLMLRRGEKEGISREYLDSLYLLGTWARYDLGGEADIEARITGVAADGRLILENTKGIIAAYDLGQVKFRT